MKSIDGTYDLVSRPACAWRAGHGEPGAATASQVHSPIAHRAGHRLPLPPRRSRATRWVRRKLRVLSGRRRSRAALFAGRLCRGLRSGRGRLSSRQRHPGPLESARRAAHLAQPGVAGVAATTTALCSGPASGRSWRASCSGVWSPCATGGLLPGWREGAMGCADFHLEGSAFAAGCGNFLPRRKARSGASATDPYWRWYFRLTDQV